VTASRRSLLVAAGCLAALVVPLVVAAAALRRPTWYPVLDLAMTELRVRDVGTAHTPLIGLPGRIGRSLADQGSHPGPLSFYLLAPTYRLLGRTAWAMQAGTVVLHAAAMAVSLLIARRRGGTMLVVAAAAVLAVLTRGYGLATMTEPWNPYLPLLWWVAFLLALWSVVLGDIALLPVAVFAASFCAQTHVPYLAMTLGLGVVAVIAVAFHARRRARSVAAWTGVALLLGVLLWTPPLVDQLREQRGNMTRLAEHFRDPPEEPVGVAKGVELALLHLDVFNLTSGQGGTTGSLVTATAEPEGSVIPGLALLLAWIAAAIGAWRMRPRSDDVFALHVVVAAGLVIGAFSMSRIFGDLWYYLMLWAWGVTALLVLATAWTAVLALRRLVNAQAGIPASTFTRLGAGALVAVLGVSMASFVVDAVDAEPPAPRLSSTLGAVTAPTADALRAGVGAADGLRGSYVITWEDALHIGSQAYGLVSELERRGFSVGMTDGLRVPNTKYRTIDPSRATAEVHFATGVYIDGWRVRDDAVEVAFVEPRTPAEVRRFDALREEAVARLERDGLDDVVPLVDTNLFGASIQRRVPSSTRELLAEMLDLGLPTAVFIAAAGTTPS
jgi:hypothetical protein